MRLIPIMLTALLIVGCGATKATKDLSRELISSGGYIDQRIALDDRIITTYRDLLEANKAAVPELVLEDGRKVKTQDVIDALNNILKTSQPIRDSGYALDRYTQAGVNASDLAKDILGQIDILSSVAKLLGK